MRTTKSTRREVVSPSRASRRPIGRLARSVVPIALAAWAGLGLVGMSTLMAGHFYTLPEPEIADPQLVARLAGLRAGVAPGEWQAIHVLYSACLCSQRIFDHLFDSERPTDFHETILLVGNDSVGDDSAVTVRAHDAGFELVTVTPQELVAEFHIEAAPLLLVMDPAGRIRYAGGYSERKQGYEALDREVMEGLKSGAAPSELPLFGCGVGKQLQAALDPLGLKYDREYDRE